MYVFRRDCCSRRSTCSTRSPRASCPSEDTGPADHVHHGGAGNLVRLDGRASARGRRASSRHDPNVTQLLRQRRLGRPGRRAPISGIMFLHLKPRVGAQAQRRPVDRRSGGRSSTSVPGHARVPAESAADPDRRAIHAQPVSDRRCRARTPTTLYKYAPMLEIEAAQLPDLTRRQQRPADRESAGQRRYRSRQGALARRLRAARSRTRSTTPTARARSRPSTRPTTSTGSSWRSSRSTRPTRRRCRCSTCARPAAPLVPLDTLAKFDAIRSGRLQVNHSGQLPSVDDLLQPRARRLTRQGARRGPASSPPRPLPPTHHHRLPGHGAGVPVLACGNLGVLLMMAILVIYLVLGILYESFIHPITILSGLPSAGFGALLTLMAVRHGARPVRVRRHHHAGRPRQEERDHDDRLRARRAAHRGQVARPTRSSRAASSASGRS